MNFKWFGPLALLAALVIGDQIRINRPGHKYRLTVAVETPDGRKSASGVFSVHPDRGYSRGGHTRTEGDAIFVDGNELPVFAESDPSALPWAELGVDVVLECTGRFRTRADAAKHLAAGARKVIVSAPMKDADATVVLGVNFPEAYDADAHAVISNASCTTNCLAPVSKVLHETLGIRHGLMTTIHATTATQPTSYARADSADERGPKRGRV